MICPGCDGTGWIWEPIGDYQHEYDDPGRMVPCGNCGDGETKGSGVVPDPPTVA